MAKRVAISNLNASTIDILNTIRANASLEYQNSVPIVQTEHDIPKVSDVLMSYPALANQFVNALINCIALVRGKSATFNNDYADFHTINGRVQYPVTIQDEELRLAFMSMDSVQDLIARIVDAIYTANEYDEYLRKKMKSR